MTPALAVTGVRGEMREARGSATSAGNVASIKDSLVFKCGSRLWPSLLVLGTRHGGTGGPERSSTIFEDPRGYKDTPRFDQTILKKKRTNTRPTSWLATATARALQTPRQAEDYFSQSFRSRVTIEVAFSESQRLEGVNHPVGTLSDHLKIPFPGRIDPGQHYAMGGEAEDVLTSALNFTEDELTDYDVVKAKFDGHFIPQ